MKMSRIKVTKIHSVINKLQQRAFAYSVQKIQELKAICASAEEIFVKDTECQKITSALSTFKAIIKSY